MGAFIFNRTLDIGYNLSMKHLKLMTAFLLLFITAACGSQEDVTPTPDPETLQMIYTAAAQTLESGSVETVFTPTPQPTETTTLQETPEPTPNYMTLVTIIDTNVNMRSGPSTTFNVIGTIQQGDTLYTTGMTPAGDWIQVSWQPAGQASQSGWVYAPLLDLSNLAYALPILASTGEQISGTVTDQDGNPISAVRIAALVPTENGEQRIETTSTGEGKFSLFFPLETQNPIHLEIVAVNCTSNISVVLEDQTCQVLDYFPTHWREDINLPQNQPVHFEYEKASTHLTGIVAYQDGWGASEILVRATRQEDMVQSERVTPQGGEFDLPLGVGTWEVVAVRFMQDGTPLIGEVYTYEITTPGQVLEPLTIPYNEIINEE